MGLIAKDSGGEGFEPIPAGTYMARCVSVIDIGVQETAWGGKEKVYIGFEVPDERVEWTDKDGKKHEGPAFIGSRYTLSINEKSILGQHLTSWRGVPFTEEQRKGFDISAVLGAPAMINIVHAEKNGKVYANIQGIMRLPKGMQAKEAESELIAYSPNDNDKAANFEKLLGWQKDLVRAGFKMAEGSTVVGSALANQDQDKNQNQPPMTAAEAMDRAMMEEPAEDEFLDDIPF